MNANLGRAIVLRGDARQIPLPDNSVDLIVTSPPYFALRSYIDGGEHYAGQIGDESTPAEYIDALIECTAEWARILKPSGSIWVNLADKYSTYEGPRKVPARSERGRAQNRAAQVDIRYTRSAPAAYGVPYKSLMGLPDRYKIACIDKLGLLVRQDQIWAKSNGMPSSATDRTRTDHERWFHLTKAERYYSALDLLRTGPSGYSRKPGARRVTPRGQRRRAMADTCNPLGPLPGSVWTVSTQPLTIPAEVAHAGCCGGLPVAGCDRGLRHHAAFPTTWPEQLITGWCPAGICTACGEGRRPLVAKGELVSTSPGNVPTRRIPGKGRNPLARHGEPGSTLRLERSARIVGEACACPDVSAPTRPAVVVDPCGGTGTTALVAKALGRTGVTIDRSADYCRLATWRTNDPRQLAKAARKPVPPKPKPQSDGQFDLFDDTFGGAA